MSKTPPFQMRSCTTPSALVLAIEDGRISRKRAYRTAPDRLVRITQAVRRATRRCGRLRGAHGAHSAR